jgi:hypothetical protein
LRAAIFIDGAYMLSLFKTHDVQPDYEAMAEYFLNPSERPYP